jgi:hypothetical protein
LEFQSSTKRLSGQKEAEKQTVKMEFIDYESSNDVIEIIDLSNHDLGCPMPPEFFLLAS